MLRKLLLLTFTVLSFGLSAQNTYTIVAQPSMSFSPSTLNINIGDTVKFLYGGSGAHTTTSTSIPSGAQPWDVPLSSSNPEFVRVFTMAGTYNFTSTPHSAHGMNGTIQVSGTSGIRENGALRSNFSMSQNYPNPATTVTFIDFEFPGREATLKVYTLIGNEVLRMNVNERKISLDVSGLSEGVYIYTLESGSRKLTRRMTITR